MMGEPIFILPNAVGIADTGSRSSTGSTSRWATPSITRTTAMFIDAGPVGGQGDHDHASGCKADSGQEAVAVIAGARIQQAARVALEQPDAGEAVQVLGRQFLERHDIRIARVKLGGVISHGPIADQEVRRDKSEPHRADAPHVGSVPAHCTTHERDLGCRPLCTRS